MPDFPVPVLAGSLVSCPGCWCVVARPDLRRHAAVCPGRSFVESGVDPEREDESRDEDSQPRDDLAHVETLLSV
jgi:hypothetical protein